MKPLGILRRPLLAIGLACSLLLVLTGVAFAHANLVKSDPAGGAVLHSAPSRVTLWFDEDVDVHFSQIQVLDRNLARVDHNDLQAVPGDPRQIVISLKPLPDGTYAVTWKALSATDGHVTAGNFAFSVGNVAGAAVAPIVPSPGSASETDPLAVLVRWLNLLALLSVVGSIFFRLLLLERSMRAVPIAEAAEAAVWSAWRQLALAAFILALVTTAASLFLEASLASGAPLVNLLSANAVPRLLNTRFGMLLIARLVLLIALGITLFIRSKFARGFAAVLGVALLLTLSLGSHSAAAGGDISLALVADWLHLTGVAIWVGGLFNFLAGVLVFWRRVTAEKRARWIAWIVPRFSAIAIPTTLVIALTGLYNSLLEIPTLNALVYTAYGDTLMIKVALFAVMIGLGAVNLLWLSPRFRRAVAAPERSTRLFSRFRLTVGFEVLLGISAIFFAGLLTLQPPARVSINQPNPSNFTAATPAPSQVLLVGEASPDVRVTLKLTPSGENPTNFDIALTDESMAGMPMPVPSVLRVILQFTLLDQDQGITTLTAQENGNEHYVLSANPITLPGMWKIHVIVRRAGVDDVAVDFPLYRPGPNSTVGANDPRALALLQSSEAAMNRLHTLRSQQNLNDGANGLLVTDYEYQSPNAMRFSIRGQSQSIAIGPKQYYQDKNGNWTEQARVDPFIFPQFNVSTQARNVQPGRTDLVNGQAAQIIRYVIPDAGGTGAQFAQWISQPDGRLLKLAMVAPAHFMTQSYSDYDSPQISVAAPPNVATETPAPTPQAGMSTTTWTARPGGPLTGDLEADIALVILVAGIALGAWGGLKRQPRQRFVWLGIGGLVVLAALGIVVDALNARAAAVAGAPVDSSQAAQGKVVYDQYCAACHGPTGHGDGRAGQNLPVRPFDLTTHVLLHDEQYLAAVISNGRGSMPAWKDTLSQEQISAVIAYTRLLALQARPGGAGQPGFTPQP